MVLASANAWEQLGHRGIVPFPGLTMIEATKQIYAGHALPERKRQKAYVPLVHGPHRP